MAEEVEGELARYKKAIEAVNKQTELGEDDSDMAGNTQKLVSAVQSLPELQEKVGAGKRCPSRHPHVFQSLESWVNLVSGSVPNRSRSIN